MTNYLITEARELGLIWHAGAALESMEEDLVTVLLPLGRALCHSITLLKNCFLARSWRRPPGYEHPSVLASETVCMFFHSVVFCLVSSDMFPSSFVGTRLSFQHELKIACNTIGIILNLVVFENRAYNMTEFAYSTRC